MKIVATVTSISPIGFEGSQYAAVEAELEGGPFGKITIFPSVLKAAVDSSTDTVSIENQSVGVGDKIQLEVTKYET